MQQLSRTTAAVLFFAVPALGVACATTPAASPPPTPSSEPATSATGTPASPPSASVAAPENQPPSKAECDAFMDIIARTTTLRASIQRDPSDATKAADWAARASELAAQATKMPVTQPDLVIESANLATRMSDLTKDLRALEAAERGGDGATKNKAHARVLTTSEQVEVITREPAARCAGDLKALRPTAGRLPPAKIQAVVRDHFGEFRLCYEDGLKRDAKLTGRVIVRFVVALDGSVSGVSDAASTPIPEDAMAPPGSPAPVPLTDAKVVACVLKAFGKLQFPKPDGGTVTVVYPIMFSPGT